MSGAFATRKIAVVSLYSLVICWLRSWWRLEGFVTQTWTEKYSLFSSNAINTCHSKWLSRKLVSITHLFCQELFKDLLSTLYYRCSCILKNGKQWRWWWFARAPQTTRSFHFNFLSLPSLTKTFGMTVYVLFWPSLHLQSQSKCQYWDRCAFKYLSKL